MSNVSLLESEALHPPTGIWPKLPHMPLVASLLVLQAAMSESTHINTGKRESCSVWKMLVLPHTSLRAGGKENTQGNREKEEIQGNIQDNKAEEKANTTSAEGTGGLGEG